MSPYIEKAKQLFTTQTELQMEDFLSAMYESYANSAAFTNDEIEQCDKVLEESLSALDFCHQDAILCAINALCVQYERIAFCDGLLAGASVILGLWDDKN